MRSISKVPSGLTVPTQPARSCTRCATRPSVPVFAKLSPNVTDLTEIARAAVDAGADGLTLVNTVLALVIDAETRRPVLGGGGGGLSGPAIKPIALARGAHGHARAARRARHRHRWCADRCRRGRDAARRRRARSRSAPPTSAIRARRTACSTSSSTGARVTTSRACATSPVHWRTHDRHRHARRARPPRARARRRRPRHRARGGATRATVVRRGQGGLRALRRGRPRSPSRPCGTRDSGSSPT